MNKTAKNNHRANRHIMRALNLIESQGFGGTTQDKKSFGIRWSNGTKFVLEKFEGKEKILLEILPEAQSDDNVDREPFPERTFPMQCKVLFHRFKERLGGIRNITKFLEYPVSVTRLAPDEDNVVKYLITSPAGMIQGLTFAETTHTGEITQEMINELTWSNWTKFVLEKFEGKEKILLEMTEAQYDDNVDREPFPERTFPMQCKVLSHTFTEQLGGTRNITRFLGYPVSVRRLAPDEDNVVKYLMTSPTGYRIQGLTLAEPTHTGQIT